MSENPTPIPDVRETMRKRQEESQKALMEQTETFRRCINIVAQTKEGKLLLKYIYRLSGYGATTLVSGEGGDIAEKMSIAKAGRASLYLDIRHLIPGNIRAEIENPNTKIEGEK